VGRPDADATNEIAKVAVVFPAAGPARLSVTVGWLVRDDTCVTLDVS
jgi:hypothetical protein